MTKRSITTTAVLLSVSNTQQRQRPGVVRPQVRACRSCDCRSVTLGLVNAACDSTAVTAHRHWSQQRNSEANSKGWSLHNMQLHTTSSTPHKQTSISGDNPCHPIPRGKQAMLHGLQVTARQSPPHTLPASFCLLPCRLCRRWALRGSSWSSWESPLYCWLWGLGHVTARLSIHQYGTCSGLWCAEYMGRTHPPATDSPAHW